MEKILNDDCITINDIDDFEKLYKYNNLKELVICANGIKENICIELASILRLNNSIKILRKQI